MKLLPLLLVALAGCSFFKKSNEKAQGHERLYSSPESDGAHTLRSGERRLVFVATNDLRGELEAKQVSASDRHSPHATLISIGGVEVFARYLEILRETYPDEVVLVDSGNSLAGAKLAQKTKAQAGLEAFARLNYQALTLGPADLKAGPALGYSAVASEWLPLVLGRQKLPLVLSNLIDLKRGEAVAWPGVETQLLKEINGVRVGFVGLFPDNLMTGKDAPSLPGHYVEPMVQAFLKHNRSLRLKGAQVVVLLTNAPVKCGEKIAELKKLPLSKVNFDPSAPSVCDPDSVLARFLSELPPQSADLVISGGTQKVANLIAGTPVISGFPEGRSFSRVDLIFNIQTNELVRERSLIHQPTLLCHRFFQESEDCYTEDPSVDHRKTGPAKFLKREIFPDQQTTAWLGPWRELAVALALQSWESDEVRTRVSGRAPALPRTQP